jgi:hypothetical protein
MSRQAGMAARVLIPKGLWQRIEDGIGLCCRARCIVKAAEQNALNAHTGRSCSRAGRPPRGGFRVPPSTALDPDYVLWSAPATQRAAVRSPLEADR